MAVTVYESALNPVGFMLRLVVTDNQYVGGNYSDVQVDVYVVGAGPAAEVESAAAVSTIIQAVQTYWVPSKLVAVNPGQTVLVASSARSVPHASDGTGYADIYGGVVWSVYGGTVGLTVTHPLTRIARKTVPNWVTPAVMGTTVRINLPRALPDFTHEVRWIWGPRSGTLSLTAATYVDWEIPLDFADVIPDHASALGLLGITTKQGGTTIDASNYDIRIHTPASMVPNVSATTWTDENVTVRTNIGALVQGQSRVRGAVTAAGVYGSTIVEKRLRVAGQIVQEGDLLLLPQPGTITASGEAVDSRTRVGSKSANLVVLPYESPKILSHDAVRATSGGVPAGNGSYIRVDLQASVQSLIVAAAQKNAATIKISTKPAGGPTWTLRNTITPGLTYNTNVLVGGGGIYSPSSSYDVLIEVSDKVGQVASQQLLVTSERVPLSVGVDGIGAGRSWTRGAVDADGVVYATQGFVAEAPSTLTKVTMTELWNGATRIPLSFPKVRVRRSAAYTLPGNTNWTPFPWDTEDYDVGGMRSDSSGALIVPEAGFYHVAATLRYGSTVYGGGVAVSVNGTVLEETAVYTLPSSAVTARPHTSTDLQLAAGDTVRIVAAGLAASLTMTVVGCFATVRRVT